MNECKCQIWSFLASWNFWKSAQRFWILRKHVSCNVKKVSVVCSNIDRFRFASFFTVPVHVFERWRFNFLLYEKSSVGTWYENINYKTRKFGQFSKLQNAQITKRANYKTRKFGKFSKLQNAQITKRAKLASLVNYKTRKLQNAQITKRANIDNF